MLSLGSVKNTQQPQIWCKYFQLINLWDSLMMNIKDKLVKITHVKSATTLKGSDLSQIMYSPPNHL